MRSRASSSTSEFGPGFQWLAASLFWCFIATLLGLQIWAASRSGSETFPFWRSLAWQTVFNLAWIPFTILIWRLVPRLPLTERPWWQWVGGHLAACLLVAVTHTLLVTALITPSMPPAEMGAMWQAWPSQLRARLYQIVVIYAGIAASGYAFVTWTRWREQADRASRLEGELAQARLASLQAQLHPHLLFNSLHAVASLVRESRNADAVRLIAGMSDLMRRLLDTDRPWHTVAEEVALVRTYLDIQRARFEDRLQVVIEVAPDCGAIRVPALVLQPLVENSLRHGFAGKVGVGHLTVTVQREGAQLRLSVEDDGESGPSESPEGGVGLRNLRSRLETLYGGAAALDAGHRDSGGFVAVVQVPVEPEA